MRLSKKVAILQSNYIPWKGYFDIINSVDVFVLFDGVQYTRRDWRNRNKIKTHQGTQWLSIPVEVSGKYSQKISEVVVSDKSWGEKHWRTLEHHYGKAKCFNHCRDLLSKIYLEGTELYLSKINYTFIVTICEILNIKTKICWSSEFQLKEEKTERLVDICQSLGATDYYSGPSARGYLTEAMFHDQHIALHYFDYSGYPEYSQLHGKFDHFVTVLDLLFNEGPDATKFMKSFHQS